MKNLQKDTCCPGGGLQNIKQLPDLIICDLKFGLGMSTAAQKKEKHQWTIEKTKARQWSETERLFFFVDLDDGEVEEAIKSASKELEISMEAAIPCKLRTKKSPNKSRETDDETKGSNKIQMTERAYIVEAHESTSKRWEPTLPKDHEDHIAERGFNSLSHYNLVHKFVPVPQAMKNSGCGSSSGQRMGEVRKVGNVAVG